MLAEEGAKAARSRGWMSASKWKMVRTGRCQGGEGAGGKADGVCKLQEPPTGGLWGCSCWGGDLRAQHLVSKITLAVALGRRMSDADEGTSTRRCEHVCGVVTEGKCSLKAPAQTRCQVMWFPIKKPKPRRMAEKQQIGL